MTIKTKHNIHDEVFFMRNNKIYKGVIEYIEAKVQPADTKPYNLLVSSEYMLVGVSNMQYEENLFSSKEELLASL